MRDAGSESGDASDASRIPLPASRVSPPDISQMSPEERATRLYNRVMTLHSRGQADSARFFLPMALQAYSMLPALDVDARYHIGVLALTDGDAAGALRAYRAFLQHEAAERARQRPEYGEHAQNLAAFHDQAKQAIAGKAPRGG